MSDNEHSEWGLPNPAGSTPGGAAPTPPPAWQPPAPATPPAGFEPSGPQAPFGGPTQPSLGGESVTITDTPPKRSRGKIVGAVVGVTALVGAGAFAFTQIGGSDDKGGAATPEEAVEQLFAALGEEDLLGAMDVLLPGERATLRDPFVEIIDHLVRLQVLGDGADLGGVEGIDLEFSNLEVDAEETNVDDIVNAFVSGDVRVEVSGEEIPIGDFVIDKGFGGDRPDIDDVDEETSFDDVMLTTVERDGSWYVSLLYTAAEYARQETDADVPEAAEAIAPVGASSPEAAVESLLNAIAALDLEAVVASLNPDEVEVLQRYAPLFIDDAQRELNQYDVEIAIDDLSLSTKKIQGSTSVVIDAISLTISAEGETVEIEVADGCARIRGAGEELDTCDEDTVAMIEEALGDLPPELEDLFATFTEAFDDLELGGITVRKADGGWYVSPVGTVTDPILAVLRALDADELEDITNAVLAVVDVFENGDFGIGMDIDDYLPDGGFIDVDEPDTSGATSVPSTVVEVTESTGGGEEGSGTDPASLDSCYAISEGPEAIQCITQGVAAGTIDPGDVDAVYLYPECGVAELIWTYEYYSLPDADFDRVTADAAACFGPLVASGEIDEFSVPTEFVHPECLPGGNIYTADSDAFNEFFDCAFSS